MPIVVDFSVAPGIGKGGPYSRPDREVDRNGNIVASTPQEMSRLVADEVKNMEQLIRTLGLKAQ
jgi:hypothetical protein